MANIIELSGVAGDDDLFTTVTTGPSPSGPVERNYFLWPEVNPGWFRAGDDAIFGGMDYLFAREARSIFSAVSGTIASTVEIPRHHGPTLGLFYAYDASSGLVEASALASTGHPQRDSSWTPLVYSPCRTRLYKSVTWVTDSMLMDGTVIFKFTPSSESAGWGDAYDALPMQLSDSSVDWKLLGNKDDLQTIGTPGAKEWATSGGVFYVRRMASQGSPSGLAASWIAGQVTLDWEEIAVNTEQGVPLTVPSLQDFESVYIQFAKGGATASGATVAVEGTFPRFAVLSGLPVGEKVVVRYKPNGVYGLALGANGAIPAFRVSDPSVVLFRYEESTKSEKFSGGRPGGWASDSPVALSPYTTPPGFIVALAPGHPMHPTSPGTGLGWGAAGAGSRVFAWSTPSVLLTTGSPGKIRAVVLSSDGLPLAGAEVRFTPSAYISVSDSVVYTNVQGEAFTEIFRIDYGIATSTLTTDTTLTVEVYTRGILVDSQDVTISLGTNLTEDEWSSNMMGGKVHLIMESGRARSGRSRRKKISLWRTNSDGCVSFMSGQSVTITCEEGRLFADGSTNATSSPPGGGGNSVTLTPITSSEDWMDKPLSIEYEPSETGEPDVIRAKWSGNTVSGVDIPDSYGALEIGSLDTQ